MSAPANEELLQLIALGQFDRVEFNDFLSDDPATEIRETVCALANDLPDHDLPGFIFLGVGDDGTIGNLSVTDDLLRQLSDIETDSDFVPSPSLTVSKRILQGKQVAMIAVQPSHSPPVRYKGTIHVRVGPGQYIANPQDVSILSARWPFANRPFDLWPVPNAKLSDLNLAQFEHDYLTHIFLPEAPNDYTMNERLAATKMIVSADHPIPTVTGMLMLGKNPQAFLPGAYIQFRRINGNDLSDDIIDSTDINGTVPGLIHQLEEKIAVHNRTTASSVGGRIKQPGEHFPTAALHQTLLNAIMHRTYQGINPPVRVTWFENRVEIISPGGAFGTINAKNFGKPGFADYRNPYLAVAMKTLGLVRCFGIGIPTAKSLLEKAGHPPLEFEVSDGQVQVTIRAM